MSGIQTLLQLVQDDITYIDETMRRDLAELSGGMDGFLLDILEYGLFGGGKRFRPLLALTSARLCGRDDDDMARLAISFEYLHLATLFHDDVIDQADIRRGRPSVAKAFGIEGAILAGDFLHARSMELVGRIGGKESLGIFCRATRSMVDGEFIQLANAQNYNQSESEYFRAIEGKTAVLISAATEIGALMGGGNSSRQSALREYGRSLGYGFQIVDDLLDYLGDEKLTGKAAGNDLAEGKMTLPLILAMEKAGAPEREKILKILRDKQLRKASFDYIYSFIRENDGFMAAQEKAEGCIDSALSSLKIFGDQRAREISILSGLAQYALTRKK